MVANRPTAVSPDAAKSFEVVFSMNASEPEDIAVIADFAQRAHPSALRVEVKKNGEVLLEKTFWGTGLLEDVVTIPVK